ncbi:MAG: hypothetical protein OXF11_08495 [Deltaproteobacteria bacterium]|nr:hypothetical protein [Deltaproteobacteria bacterium]
MKVLMCPPLHYEPAPGEDASAVMAEWRGLYRLLRDELDVQVDLLEPRPDMPKLVTAASGGFVWKDTFIASRPRDVSRRPEAEAWANFFMVRGYAMPDLPEGCTFEGGRDLVVADGTLYAGYRTDDDLAAHQALSEILDHEVQSLRLSDGWDWPLDTCLCPVGDGSALFLPDAFDPAARKEIQDHVPRLHPVDADDARRLGCNALFAGRNAVLPKGCRETGTHLKEAGFQVHHLPVAAYARHGAGPKALVLKIAG